LTPQREPISQLTLPRFSDVKPVAHEGILKIELIFPVVFYLNVFSAILEHLKEEDRVSKLISKSHAVFSASSDGVDVLMDRSRTAMMLAVIPRGSA
jgi:hypothetical protein